MAHADGHVRNRHVGWLLLGLHCEQSSFGRSHQASYDITLARTPALGTLWIYAIVCLELGYAMASVLLFGAYVYAAGLKLVL